MLGRPAASRFDAVRRLRIRALRAHPRPWWPANTIGRVRGWQSAETVKNSVVGNGEIFCTHRWRG